MAKEVLAVPEEKLSEVIRVIQAGLEYVDSGAPHSAQISDERENNLLNGAKSKRNILTVYRVVETQPTCQNKTEACKSIA